MSGAGRPVQLVETDEPARARASDGGLHWSRRRLAWALGTAVLLGCGAVGVQGAFDAHERSRIEALAGVPGMVRPLSRHLEVAWRLSVDEVSAVWSAPTAGVLIAGSSGTSFVLTGRDATTGAPLWSTRVRPVPGPDAWTWCQPTARPDGDVAVCTAGASPGPWETTGPDRTLWVVNPRTGTVLVRQMLPASAQLAAQGGDLLVARPAGNGWRLDATEPVTGATRWTFATGPVEATSTADLDAPTLVDAAPGVLLVVPGHMWSVSTDGRLRTRVDDDSLWWTALRGGAVLGFRQDGTGGSGYRSRLVLADGSSIVGHDHDLGIHPDDGSARDVVLTTAQSPAGSQVVARSASDGSALWDAPGAPSTAMMLEGRLYLGSRTEIVAVDPRTGHRLWRHAMHHPADGLSTDGRSLLVTRDPSFVDAYDLGGGTPRWTADLNDVDDIGGPVVSVGFYGLTGHLLASLEDGSVVALR